MNKTLKAILTGGTVALALAVAAVPAAHAGGKGKGHHGGHHHGHHWKSPYKGHSYYGYPKYYYSYPVTYGHAPWTPGWYLYCKTKYKSFNPATGKYLGYNGQYYFCK